MMCLPRLALTSWLVTLTLVSGCSSPAQKVERNARTARSWAATARNTSEALSAGAVPRVYATQVLRAALDTQRRLAQQPEWRAVPADTRTQLAEAIRELSSSISRRPDSLARP